MNTCFIGERPALRQDEIIPAIIRNNMDYFTEHIEPRQLINKLHGLGIIRDERMRHLRSMSHKAEKNYEVLNIIRAAPIEDYYRFVQCLRETDQSLVAEVAEKGGGEFNLVFGCDSRRSNLQTAMLPESTACLLGSGNSWKATGS